MQIFLQQIVHLAQFQSAVWLRNNRAFGAILIRRLAAAILTE